VRQAAVPCVYWDITTFQAIELEDFLMKKLIFCVIIAMAMMLSACAARVVRGSGNVISETRNVRSFERIDVCCGMELILSQANQESLEIEAEDNIIAEIKARVVGDTLEIGYIEQYPETAYWPTKPIRLYLSAEKIREIEISGGGELDAFDIETDSFDLHLSGGSDAEIDALNVDDFDLDVSGGGDVKVSGQVIEQRIDLSGGSCYEASEFESEEAVINVSGGSNAEIWATETVDINASGGSTVTYYGQPILNSNTSGGSNVKSLGSR